LQRTIFLLFGIACFSLFPAVIIAEDMPAIVSTEWLAQSLSESGLVLIDIRPAAQFNKGHIPGSLNAPFGLWAISQEGLALELPPDKTFQNLLGTFGIHPSSRVVVVSGTETDFARADATRVAWTCKVGGIENVAVLSGGYNQWVEEGKTVSTDAFRITPFKYDGIIDRSSSISMNELLGKIGKAAIVDARTPGDFFGITAKTGHIESAVNLPAPWAFTTAGTLRDRQDLQAMAEGVIGKDRNQEVIVYCEVGGYASTWWFLLSQVLGYQNVKIYDGSIEEWIKDPDAPVSIYRWD
jgi:thiosulfate/3-mercaptopyruvate sulfurtransferase